MRIFSKRAAPKAGWALLFVSVLALVALLPIAWMTLSAFKPEDEINQIPPTFLPHASTLENFLQLFSQFHFGVLTINTIIVSFIVVALSLSLGGAAAYGLSRHPFFGLECPLSCHPHHATDHTGVVRAAALPDDGHAASHQQHHRLGDRHHRPQPSVCHLDPEAILQFPAAGDRRSRQLDGLGPVGIFWRFAITLAGPGFKTVALFSFISAWTDLLIPITMSTRPEGWTLTAGIVQMQTGFKIYWGALMAGGLYLTLPSFVIAIAMQKSLTRGLRTTF